MSKIPRNLYMSVNSCCAEVFEFCAVVHHVRRFSACLLSSMFTLCASFKSIWIFWMLIHLLVVGWRLLLELHIPIWNDHSLAKFRLKADHLGPCPAEVSQPAGMEISQPLWVTHSSVQTLSCGRIVFISSWNCLTSYLLHLLLSLHTSHKSHLCLLSKSFHSQPNTATERADHKKPTKDELIFKALTTRIAKSHSL